MSHKNYSAKPLDHVEPFKKKLVAQAVDVAAIEKENALVTKHVEDLSGLQVANSEILIATNIGDITDYNGLAGLPNIGNTNPSVQDISEYNPIPKPIKIKPNAPASATVVDNEVIAKEPVVAAEVKETEKTIEAIESVEEKQVDTKVSDITESPVSFEDLDKEII